VPSKPKYRHRLHVSVGTAGLCPDCKEPTPFHRAALLGECPQTSWTIDADLLRALSGTLSSKVVCKKCREKPTRFHWVELGEAAVLGPFCSVCLRDQRQDVPVYVASASRTTLLVSAVVREYAPKLPAVTAPDTDLF
jgi:hypothetical protein